MRCVTHICQKCGAAFPASRYVRWRASWVRGDRRKYCFGCSPPGKRSRVIRWRWAQRSNKYPYVCKRCKLPFVYKINRRMRKNQCRRCCNQERSEEHKRRIVKHMGGKCARCGYCKNIRALDCHHVERSKKAKNISKMIESGGVGWEHIVKELKLCVLLCANCHREEHHPHLNEE